ncbi:MAG: histone deacetylase, partial [Sphingomonas sp.]|nr:histone deacetylase [Sphingomonas sp.]
SLTPQGLVARDTFVGRAAAARGIALASTVGGGYGRDVAVLAEAHVRAILTLGQAYQEARFTGAVALP